MPWLSLALAQVYVTELGAEVGLSQNGTFARALWTEEGWMLAYGAGQDYHVAPLVKDGDRLEDWVLDHPESTQLTQHGALRDHSITDCPDGTWLHLGSSSVSTDDDSAYAFHYSADWQLLDSSTVAESVDERSHNDMVAFCTEELWGSTFPHDGQPRNYFRTLDPDLDPLEEIELADFPRMTGGSLLLDGDRIWALGFDHRPVLWVVEYDAAFEQQDRFGKVVTEEPLRAYWPQGFIRIGEVYLVAHMLRDEQAWGSQDDVGNVQLVLFDQDWQILEQHTLTFNDHEEAGQRPHLAVQGDTLLMSYDRALELTLVEMRLDLDRFFPSQDTSDTADSGVDTDGTGDDTGSVTPPDCGCTAGSSSGLLIAPLLLLAGRRRRRGPPP